MKMKRFRLGAVIGSLLLISSAAQAYDIRIMYEGYEVITVAEGETLTLRASPALDEDAVLAQVDRELPRLTGDVREATVTLAWPNATLGATPVDRAIDLIRAADRFPKMTPPASAPPLAHEGYTAFRMYCTRCHPVNGEGGSIGPELNAAGREVGMRDEAWLRRWIDDPSQFAPNARMPALDRDLPDRAQTLDALIGYLRAMAGTNATTEPRMEDDEARTPHGG